MVSQKTKLIAITLVFFALTLCAWAKKPHQQKILWIGNSYTMYNDLPDMVSAIAHEQGLTLLPTRFLKGGEHLSGHYANHQLREALIKGGWDYVVIQEYSTAPAQSTREVINDTYHYAHLLDSLAKVGSPQTHVIFYMTWAHKETNVHNSHMRDPAYPLDENYTDFQNHLRLSYLEMTYENRAWCSPVGMAWQTLRKQHPEIELYAKDNYHPSLAGSFLAAHCFVTTILQHKYKSKLQFKLPSIHANIIQQTAQETVLNNKRILGLMRPLIYKYDNKSHTGKPRQAGVQN